MHHLFSQPHWAVATVASLMPEAAVLRPTRSSRRRSRGSLLRSSSSTSRGRWVGGAGGLVVDVGVAGAGGGAERVGCEEAAACRVVLACAQVVEPGRVGQLAGELDRVRGRRRLLSLRIEVRRDCGRRRCTSELSSDQKRTEHDAHADEHRWHSMAPGHSPARSRRPASANEREEALRRHSEWCWNPPDGGQNDRLLSDGHGFRIDLPQIEELVVERKGLEIQSPFDSLSVGVGITSLRPPS